MDADVAEAWGRLLTPRTPWPAPGCDEPCILPQGTEWSDLVGDVQPTVPFEPPEIGFVQSLVEGVSERLGKPAAAVHEWSDYKNRVGISISIAHNGQRARHAEMIPATQLRAEHVSAAIDRFAAALGAQIAPPDPNATALARALTFR